MVLDDWSVQQLRVSLFTSEPVLPSEAGWKALTGEDEAENRVTVPGGRQYSGKLLDGLLALTYSINRIDIVLAWDPTKNVTPPNVTELPVFGKWLTASSDFASKVEPFLETLPTPVVRIAFGGNLLFGTNTRLEAYQALQEMLKSVSIDADNMRELIFRINWPLQSSIVSGLDLNRITAWSSLVFTTNLMQASAAGLAVAETGLPSIHAVSLELDHNTSGDRKEPLDKGQLVPIFRELVTLAAQNASQGERPL
jgi:hypothetical protein